MDNQLREEIYRLHAHICSGLADPLRILILYTLDAKPYNVSELAEVLGISQPTASRHLKVLRERGLVNAQRSAQAVYYSLADTRVIDALNLLRAVLNTNLESQARLVFSSRADLAC
jgi:ArsR family transcriptional regulator